MNKLLNLLFVIVLCGSCTKIPKEYLVEEKDLVPEGIAYSEKQDAFYLTSIAKSKIIVIDRKSGRQFNFINEREFGFTPGAGICVDDEQNLLHAIGGYFMLSDSLSSLFTFDINTRNLLRRYNVTDEGEHFLNDMVKGNDGTIYLTDTKASSIYLLKQGDDSLELFFRSPEIEFPNGIAISDDNSRLYIASNTKGVRILEISTKKILNGIDTSGLSQGIDGLEIYKNQLYAIQNSSASNPFNFRKLILNQAQDEILDVEVINNDTLDLNVPLTFCLAQDNAIIIGNSNLQYLDQVTFEFNDNETIPKTRLVVHQLD